MHPMFSFDVTIPTPWQTDLHDNLDDNMISVVLTTRSCDLYFQYTMCF